MAGLFCLRFGSHGSLSYPVPGGFFWVEFLWFPRCLCGLSFPRNSGLFFFCRAGCCDKGNYDALRSDAFIPLSLLLLLVVLSARDSLLISPVVLLSLPFTPLYKKTPSSNNEAFLISCI